MQELAVIVVRGLGIGAVFALIAFSLNAVNRASGIFNFAQGAMMVLGGTIAARYMPNIPDPYRWFLFLPVATFALGAVMTMQGYITLLPLRSSVEQHSWLVSTLAVSVLIGAIILLIQGNSQILTTSQFPSFPLFGTRTPAPYMMTIILALIWYLVLRPHAARSRRRWR